MENLGNIYIYVPRKDLIIFMQAGDGSQLLASDYEDGYVSYVDFQAHKALIDSYGIEVSEYDGGICMYKEPLEDMFTDLEQCVPDVLEELLDDREWEYVILKRDCV